MSATEAFLTCQHSLGKLPLKIVLGRCLISGAVKRAPVCARAGVLLSDHTGGDNGRLRQGIWVTGTSQGVRDRLPRSVSVLIAAWKSQSRASANSGSPRQVRGRGGHATRGVARSRQVRTMRGSLARRSRPGHSDRRARTSLWNRKARRRRVGCLGCVEFQARAPGYVRHEALRARQCD